MSGRRRSVETLLAAARRDIEFPLNAKQLGMESRGVVRRQRRRLERAASLCSWASLLCLAALVGACITWIWGGVGAETMSSLFVVLGCSAGVLSAVGEIARGLRRSKQAEERAWRRSWKSFSARDLSSPLTPFLREELEAGVSAPVAEVCVGVHAGMAGSIEELIELAEASLTVVGSDVRVQASRAR